MAKRKSNKKSAKSKNAKRAKIPEVQPEAPIELRPGFKNQLITSLIKLTLAATEGPPTCLKLVVRDPRTDFSKILLVRRQTFRSVDRCFEYQFESPY